MADPIIDTKTYNRLNKCEFKDCYYYNNYWISHVHVSYSSYKEIYFFNTWFINKPFPFVTIVQSTQYYHDDDNYNDN